MSVNYGGTTTFRQPKARGEGAIAYNKRMQDEYYARQMADVADFKARQRKVIDDKIAHERAMALEKLNQAGQTTRTGMTTSGQYNVADRQELGATKRAGMAEAGLDRRFDKKYGLQERQFDFLKENEDRNFKETSTKNKFDRFSVLSGIGSQGEFGAGASVVSPGEFGNRSAQFRAFASGDMESDITASVYKKLMENPDPTKVELTQAEYDLITKGQQTTGQNPAMSSKAAAAPAKSPTQTIATTPVVRGSSNAPNPQKTTPIKRKFINWDVAEKFLKDRRERDANYLKSGRGPIGRL